MLNIDKTIQSFYQLFVTFIIGIIAIIIKIQFRTVFFSILSSSAVIIIRGSIESYNRPFFGGYISLIDCIKIMLLMIVTGSIYWLFICVNLMNLNYKKHLIMTLTLLFASMSILSIVIVFICKYISQNIMICKIKYLTKNQKLKIKYKIMIRLKKMGFSYSDISRFVQNAKMKSRKKYFYQNIFDCQESNHDTNLDDVYSSDIKKYNRHNKYGINDTNFGKILNNDYKRNQIYNKVFEYLNDNINNIYNITYIEKIMIKLLTKR